MRVLRCWAASSVGVDSFEQVEVAAEERAVDPGAASDAGDAEFRAVFGGVVKGGKDPPSVSGGVGSTSVDHCVDGRGGGWLVMGISPGAGGRVWPARGVPSIALQLWLSATACDRAPAGVVGP